jgi:hypothetical protein
MYWEVGGGGEEKFVLLNNKAYERGVSCMVLKINFPSEDMKGRMAHTPVFEF